METEPIIKYNLSFCDILALVFIVLKLTHYINWSWWWVLAPLWMPLAIILAILALCGVAFIIGTIVNYIIH